MKEVGPALWAPEERQLILPERSKASFLEEMMIGQLTGRVNQGQRAEVLSKWMKKVLQS